MRIRSILAWSVASVILMSQTTVQAQFYESQLPNPKECRVVVEELGRVGYRISDAQQLAQITLTHLRNRMGQNAVIYEGAVSSAKNMKRMLGPQSETEIQDEQIAYYKAAIDNAKFRVRIRFGKKNKKHWASVTCRNFDSPPSQVLAEKRFEAKKFREVLRLTDLAMPQFCTIMDPEKPKPTLIKKKRKAKEWSLPPRR
jgi:hypothetical protein